jgi:hypothetical protein
MSEEQAINLLDKEVAQGKYILPEISKLTEKERTLKSLDLPINSAISLPQLKRLMKQKADKQKYRGCCYQLSVKIIEKKLKMVCYLQNLRHSI